ncbi:hypothetical protein KIPB_011721, partial [Kipferlia bialata]
FGLAMSVSDLGFTSAFRRLVHLRDSSQSSSHILSIMLGVAFLMLYNGLFGTEIASASPLTYFVPVGGMIFTFGMQLSSSCASGHMLGLGRFNVKSWAALPFFCCGSFLGVIVTEWVQDNTPMHGGISFFSSFGTLLGGLLQLALLTLVLIVYWAVDRHQNHRSPQEILLSIVPNKTDIMPKGEDAGLEESQTLMEQGEEDKVHESEDKAPLVALAAAHPTKIPGWLYVALFMGVWNATMLLLTGNTFGCSFPTLYLPSHWLYLLGVPVDKVLWWSKHMGSLTNPVALTSAVWQDAGLMIAAGLVAGLSAFFAKYWRKLNRNEWIGAAVGGLCLGVGARLGYGCNIGAFFSGLMTCSLHAWLWFGGAIP